MKLSFNWLQEFVALDFGPEELAEKLTRAGIEVEGLDRIGANLMGVEIVEIIKKERHPNADSLSLVTIQRPSGQTPMIVCGAPNVRVGNKAVFAPVGTQLPEMKITEAEIRGVKSAGMLCSEKELGLSDKAAGLMVVPYDWVPGPLLKAFNFFDTVLEVSLTPNRGDCLSVLGLAREVSALTGASLKRPEALAHRVAEGFTLAGRVSVDNRDPERCPRYTVRIFDVTVRESPFWMQHRLNRSGIRPINNVVDITNYVLLETGHPLHAFDLMKLEGARIVIRRAAPGERILALDGREYELAESDCVIADDARPAAIAGIMGGEQSSVGNETARIALESACFNPLRIRRSSKRLGLHSESSYRFERGVDIDGVDAASDRVGFLLKQIAHGRASEEIIDCRPAGVQPRTLEWRPSRARLWLGVDVGAEQGNRHLESLGFKIVSRGEDRIGVVVPSWRGDIEREIDLVEEIARLYGYDNIPSQPLPPAWNFRHQLREGLAGPEIIGDRWGEVKEATAPLMADFGFHEAVNLSFAAEGEEDWTGFGQPIHVTNPLAPEQALLRRSLLSSLLRNLRTNLNRQTESVRLYEIGKIYRQPDSPALPSHEEWRMALAAVGPRRPRSWDGGKAPYDFHDLKAVVEAWMNRLGLEMPVWEPQPHPLFHPGKSARIRSSGQCVGHLGEIHPDTAARYDIPPGAVLAELDLEWVLSRPAPALRKVTPLPKFPAVDRDLAFLVDSSVTAGSLLAAVQGLALEALEDAFIFDSYEGKPIPPGRKSIGLRLRFRHRDRTLTEEEVLPLHESCVRTLRDRFGAELRDS